MTAKEYLLQAKHLDDIINCRLRELNYWRSLSLSISGSRFEEHHNPNKPTEAPFVRCVEKIDEIERDVNTKIDALINLRGKINKAIDMMDNYDEQLLLRYRYLDSLTWRKISEIMLVSIRTVYRIHGTALQNFRVPN